MLIEFIQSQFVKKKTKDCKLSGNYNINRGIVVFIFDSQFSYNTLF